MSRLPSIDIPNAIYYLQLQSNGHCQLLPGRQDFRELRELFTPLTQDSGGRLLGYCLFQDSLHFLVQAGNGGITAFGQWLIDTHTQHHNASQGRNGSLYSQQILSVLIDPQHYLLPVIHQLHWLPVRQGLVASPSAYPWTSHRDYLAPECPPWLDRSQVLVRVANHRASQLRRYEQFIENTRLAPVDWVEGVCAHYRALASDSYIQALQQRHREHQILPVLDLDALTEWICREYALEEKDLLLWRRHRLGVEVQAMVAALARTFAVANPAKVADYFRCDRDVLEAGIRALESRRGMYLFKLQLRLDQWLIRHFQASQPATESHPLADTNSDIYAEDSALGLTLEHFPTPNTVSLSAPASPNN